MRMSRMPPSRAHPGEIPEIAVADDELPTQVYTRSDAFDAASVLGPPSDHRWPSPSPGPYQTADAQRAIIARMIRELPPLNPLVSRDSHSTSAPPPVPPRKRRSMLPFLTAAMAIALGVGLWRDPAARASVLTELARAGSQLLETTIR